MVVAQLVERPFPIPEVHGSNRVIDKIYIEHLFTVNCIEKTKIKKKRPGMAHLRNKGSCKGKRLGRTSAPLIKDPWLISHLASYHFFEHFLSIVLHLFELKQNDNFLHIIVMLKWCALIGYKKACDF